MLGFVGLVDPEKNGLFILVKQPCIESNYIAHFIAKETINKPNDAPQLHRSRNDELIENWRKTLQLVSLQPWFKNINLHKANTYTNIKSSY